MALLVRIGDPRLLDDLVSILSRNDCIAQPVADDACRVVHVFAGPADEALRELVFFLRAWQLGHPGVSAAVTY
jgi:hypothetical protein